MTEQSNTSPFLATDAEASMHLAAALDPWIDLTKPNTEGEWLMRHLQARYEEALASFLPATKADPEMLQTFLRLLVRQLCRAQADIFVLKSALLNRDKLVLTRDWEYQDPLRTYRSVLGEDAARAATQSLGHYLLAVDDDILGVGWHGVERDETRVWRWSGPGLYASLALPRFFDSAVRLEVGFDLIRREALSLEGAIRINGRPVQYTLHFDDGKAGGTINFEADLTGDSSPFFQLEFNLTRTYSPQRESGSSDARELGICLLWIRVSRQAIADGSNAGPAASVASALPSGDESSLGDGMADNHGKQASQPVVPMSDQPVSLIGAT